MYVRRTTPLEDTQVLYNVPITSLGRLSELGFRTVRKCFLVSEEYFGLPGSKCEQLIAGPITEDRIFKKRAIRLCFAYALAF